MAALGSGAPGREMTVDDASRRGLGWQILAILVVGLIVRLMMAYGFDALRGSGFETDLRLFEFWARNLAENGPFGFYERGFFADYTPGYLYALWVVGIVGEGLGATADLIKLPAIITDVVLAWVVYRMVLDLGVTERRARLAAIVVLVNPITWFDSVIWGQVDSFGTVFLLLSIRELWKGRHERSAILAVVAALIKPQLAILVPIVAVVTIRRALWPAGAYGDEPAPEPSGLGWERRTTGAVRILTTGVAGFVTAVALSAPFGLSVVSLSATAPYLDSSLLRLVFSTAATYSYVTVNAYNLWALFPVDGVSTASGGGWIPDAPIPDATAWATIGPFPAALVGGVLLGALLFVIVPAIVARRPDRLTILVGVCVLALAFFAVPTRVHERYLFPFFGLAAILFAFSWRWRIAYVVASVATFLNMYVVLTTLYDSPKVEDWLGIGPDIRSFWGVAFVAVLHTAALLFGLVQLRDGARRRLAAELDDGRQPVAVAGAIPVMSDAPAAEGPAGAGVVAGVAAAGATATAQAAPVALRVAARSATPRARRIPAWYERRGWNDLGPIAWLRSRIGETPIRPDRSRLLATERGGRLDRLDLWILIVLVIASMGLRTFRLAEPARMHFDEVYHARTATEFLQFWRYGISTTIYEWTHPHLAKYAMAGGIALFAGHDVSAASDLGVPVRDAAIEPRRADPLSTDRAGDRVWVATGDAVVAYDLETREPVTTVPLPGSRALVFDPDGLQLFVGTDAGDILALDATLLDGISGASSVPGEALVEPVGVAAVGAPIEQLAVFDGGQALAVRLAGDEVAIVDPSTGEERGRTLVAGASDMAAAGQGDAIIATPAEIPDLDAAARELAAVLGGDAGAYLDDLGSALEGEPVVIDAVLSADVRTDLDEAITAGRLPGITVEETPLVAVTGADGVSLISTYGTLVSQVVLDAGASSVALVSGVDEGTQLYVTTFDPEGGVPEVAVIAASGGEDQDWLQVSSTFQLPGEGRRIVYDATAELVEVLGATPDGTGTTIYVVEPHGKSVFADHQLPFEPTAWVLDHNADYPADARGEIVAFGEGGEAASVDVGSYHFSWRLPGVILGALTVAILFLLARVLFTRRAIAVLVGLFVLLDGMMFVQSRIAMNDVYTGTFILAAYLLFAWLWIEQRRARSFWLLMPAIGILLGLALASKWVAAYAIGALGILVLVRSALGRIILIAGLVGLTGVLGWMAMAVPADSEASSGNLLFALIMVALTLAAVVVTVYRPISWSDEEVRLAVGGPAVLGILIALGAIAMGEASTEVAVGPILLNPLTVAFALIVTGGLAYVAFQVGGRYGMGPMAPPPSPDDPRALVPPPAPPAEGWLRLGSGFGLPMVWMVVSLLAVPLVVYVALYVPWAFMDNHQLVAGWPGGNTGQTLVDLTGAMYRYHNNLTAAHAASSPWWAWPLNLKPVWFFQGSFAGPTAASIYDAGNMVIWWMGIPAMAFVAYQAFRRRSLALALILIAFLAQWISWARIDRAAFQYHYYTSLPFVILALGYFMAELWHGASRRTWLLARVAASIALLGPVILWLLRIPLCALAGVESVNAGSQACNGNPGNLVVTPAAFAMVVVGLATLLVLVRLLVRLSRPRDDGRPLALTDLTPLVLVAVGGGVLLALTQVLPAEEPLFSFPGIVPELIALLVALPLVLIASQVVTARDARRFVLGFVGVTGFWFVFLYPNIAALPLPSTIVNAYQGILPTYIYAFQFSVNTIERGAAISFADPRFAILMLFLVLACAVVAYSARIWRMAPGNDAAPAGGPSTGPAGEAGGA